MLWFLTPRFYFDGAGDPYAELECPGMLDQDGVTVIPAMLSIGFVVQAYDYGADQCLVGVTAPLNLPPDGWTSLDIDEAKTKFADVVGRSSSTAEVF